MSAVPVANRIDSLDVFRGFALLGILIMNVQAFAMPSAAYFNPLAFGDFTGVNFFAWLISHLLAEAKFMTMFSLLFGAGIIIFTENAALKHQTSLPLFLRRNFWLLIFGIIHGYFIWYGDILYHYALCALLVYGLRRLSSAKLFFIGLTLVMLGSIYQILIGQNIPYLPQDVLKELESTWRPSQQMTLQEISAYQGDIVQQFEYRAPMTFMMQTEVFLSSVVWRVTGLMTFGMALYKSGFLSLQVSKKFYQRVIIFCLPFGIVLVAFGAFINIQENFSFEYSFFIGSQFNYWGSILVSFGYLAILALILLHSRPNFLLTSFKNIGRTALSNYVLQSLIFTTIFYGHGLGFFGELSRIEQLLLVIITWPIQIWLSSLWLKYFHYGPLEWSWRVLTYWDLPAFKK